MKPLDRAELLALADACVALADQRDALFGGLEEIKAVIHVMPTPRGQLLQDLTMLNHVGLIEGHATPPLLGWLRNAQYLFGGLVPSALSRALVAVAAGPASAPVGGRLRIYRLEAAPVVCLDTTAALVTIGRSTANDLVVADKHVSGYHAEIQRRPGGYVFRHRSGSTTSKLVRQGEQIRFAAGDLTETALFDQDRVHIAGVEYAVAIDLESAGLPVPRTFPEPHDAP